MPNTFRLFAIRRTLLCTTSAFLSLAGLWAASRSVTAEEKPALPPNVVIIFADDLGYGDLSCQGATGYATPHLDRMAKEGARFTRFLVPAAVCSASRAALLTGCYPQRVSILGALGPGSKTGIHPDELLLPEVLKPLGYATAIYGKWHLGDAPPFLPMQHGFDDYFGLPYSNDMWPHHPTSKSYPDLPLIEQNRVIAKNPDQTQLTTWYTEHAVKFIEAHQQQPFFLYVPHSMPHVPLFVSDKFRGKTDRGLFGDVIEELDWSVGQVLDTLKRLDLDERTIVIFTSDNGPWLSYGDHAGTAGPLREGKGTTWEGGQRVPFIARWPGKIPAGHVSDEFATTMDLLPTLARLAGGEDADPRARDGHNIWPLLSGQPGAQSPYDVFYFYWDRDLQAVSAGPWKLHFPHSYRTLVGEPGSGGTPGPYKQGETGLELYNLEVDIGETKNVAAEHPEVVARLQALAEKARADLGSQSPQLRGNGVRAPGRLNGAGALQAK